MAENLVQYKAYPALLTLLQQHALPKDAISQVIELIAQIVAEAVQSNGQSQGKVQPQQKQQAAAIAAAPLRDLQAADAVLEGVSFIIPRGKFNVGFYADSMQASNKQTSVTIPYSSIKHVLVIDAIPKQPNTTNIVLVMKSGQPVQQGKNVLDMVVVQTKDLPELQLAAPAACQHLGDTLAGPAAVVLSQLLASYIEEIEDDTFLTADTSIFSSNTGDMMIAANSGVTSGWLVPLSAGICYIGKPGRFIPTSSISKVLFHRAGGGSSTFDITLKQLGAGKPLELGQIDAAELNKLQLYLMTQRIKMGADDDDDADDAAVPAAGGAAAAAAATAAADDDDDDEEDSDFDPEASDDGGDAEPSSKKQKLAAAADGSEEEDDASEEEESDDDSDVSLVDEDNMDEDDDDDM